MPLQLGDGVSLEKKNTKQVQSFRSGQCEWGDLNRLWNHGQFTSAVSFAGKSSYGFRCKGASKGSDVWVTGTSPLPLFPTSSLL